MRTDLIQGDCIEKMKELEENSVDSIVTDPPYGLEFMGKEWDKGVPNVNFWKEMLRVLKPGGYLLSFGGSRTYHRMASGIEDAGFEIRDQIMWLYGSGFPKSHNIGKAVDKLQGNERKILGERKVPDQRSGGINSQRTAEMGVPTRITTDTKGNSPYEGWGTALKPAHEPIVMARKPLSEKTVAKNVLKWGTGGINIDGCRVGTESISTHNAPKGTFAGGELDRGSDTESYKTHQGRFPANIILDEEAAKMLDEQSGVSKGGKTYNYKDKQYKVEGFIKDNKPNSPSNRGDKGGASRFFYCPKASKSERNAGCEELEGKDGSEHTDRKEGSVGLKNPASKGGWSGKSGNHHPTIKPVKLMEYLVRLVTPKGGTVLDPFMGSGTTGIACKKEEFNFIGMEKEEEYCKIAETRIKAIRINNKLL